MVKEVREAIWHADGHFIRITLEKAEVVVRLDVCPHGRQEGSECWHRQAPCVVEWFINVYGLDCNVGVSGVSEVMEIAWSLQGDCHDLTEDCQMWLMPLADEAFASWLEAKKGSDVSG